MARVALFTHPRCLDHDPGDGSPERPARLEAILNRVAEEPGVSIVTAEPIVDLAPLRAVHPEAYLEYLAAVSRGGGGALLPDTAMNGATWDAVLAATGAVVSAVQHTVAGKGHAFAAVRPPGHHALRQEVMGFCFTANVVVAARAAQERGCARVLIVDWDVHHGNGTQALIEHDRTMRLVSLHQHPWYPGTGAESERGVGNVFNVPRPPGLEPERYVEDLWAAVREAVEGWTPELVIISAGYDSMHGDPLGGFTLEPDHYVTLTHRIREALPAVPILASLEGGYAPARLAEGVAATLGALA